MTVVTLLAPSHTALMFAVYTRRMRYYTLKMIDAFIASALTCITFAETPDESIGKNLRYSRDLRRKVELDAAAFLAFCEARNIFLNDYEMDQAGIDFIFTRNGHGCGFWDRGLEELGERLTKACKRFKECNLYVGDDKKIYIM